MAAQISHAELAELPTPEHITLLFKHHKSTVVLSVIPTKPWTEIKSLLLAALKSRNLDTFPGSDVRLPEDAEELEFGILQDKKDITSGWISVDGLSTSTNDNKAGKRKPGGKQTITNESPAGAGLIDGGLVAYRMKADLVSVSESPDNVMHDILDEPEWDVVIPSYDDEGDEPDP